MIALIGLLVLVLCIVVGLVSATNKGSRQPAQLDDPPPPTRKPARVAAPAPRVDVRIVVGASAPARAPSPATRSAASAPLRAVTLDSCWVPPGQIVRFGTATTDGMIFVLADAAARATTEEASLIEMGLPARPSQGERMPYYPRYSQIEPGARGEYLTWLTTGRRQPDVQLGCVFLFFYGLERRLLFRAVVPGAARDEAPLLLAELRALLVVYGANASFAGYANRFIAVCGALYPQAGDDSPEGALEIAPTWVAIEALKLRVALQVGRLVKEGRPIDPSWALAWYVSSDLGLRTPAQRCWPQFRALFAARFRAAYGAGLVVAPNRSRFRLNYLPANPSLLSAGGVELDVGDLPDIARLSRPLRDIALLVAACTDALDPYSRWLGKGGEKESLQAAAMLPRELVTNQTGANLGALRTLAEGAIGTGEHGSLAVDRIFELWPPEKGDKMTKKETTLIAQLFEKLGYGIEPDARFGGASLERGENAVVFRTSPDAPDEPSAIYKNTTVLLHVAAAVAIADGRIDPAEQAVLRSHIATSKGLSADERSRLGAHSQWLLGSGATLRAIQKRLAGLDQRTSRAVAAVAVTVAGSDGHLDGREVKALEKIYAGLGLPAESLFDDLNEMRSGAAEPAAIDPVVVRAGKPADRGFRLPPAPGRAEAAAGGVVLDMARVRAKLAETAAASELLAGIFVDEADPVLPSSAPTPDDDEKEPAVQIPQPGNLDAAHAAFAKDLGMRAQWTADDLAAAATIHGLLGDGALDVINEAALDRCGEPAWEGSDPVDVNQAVVEELLR